MKLRSLAPALLVLPLLFVASALPAAADEVRPRGLLAVRSQFPLDLVTLDMTPGSAFMPPQGTVSFAMQLVHANTFEITPAYDQRVTAFEAGAFPGGWDFNVDAETTRAALTFDVQLGRRVALGIEAPLIAHQGGFMDSIIEDVHETLGLPQNDRHLKERDQVNIDLVGGTRRARLDDGATAFGDMSAHCRFQLWSGGRSALTAVAEVKIPTGDEESFTGSGEWDYGLSMLLSAGSERHVFHAGVGHHVLGQPETWPFAIEDRTTVFAGYELVANESWSIVVHALAATSILPEQSGYKQDGSRAEIVAGFHWTRGAFRLSSGFTENITTADNAHDLGVILQFGWEVRP